MARRLKCDALDVLGRSSLQNLGNPSAAAQWQQEQLQVGMQPKLHVGRYLGYHARTGSILIMTAEGVVKAARMFEGWTKIIDGMSKIGMLFEVLFGMYTETEADAADAVQRLHDLELSIFFWRHVGAMSQQQT